MLRCPNDRSTLHARRAGAGRAAQRGDRGGRLRNQAGEPVERPIDGGLIRAAGDLVYPIVDQIPVMLYDEAIPLAQLEGA